MVIPIVIGIMPNHLHVLIALKNATQTVNTVVSNGKRFMAYEIVATLKKQGQKEILEKLSSAVNASDSRRGKLHQVFEPSFDCKECYSESFTEQKLNYMHHNPCNGIWNLATNPIEYRHSSAKFYLTGASEVYEVTNYKELMDIDLSK